MKIRREFLLYQKKKDLPGKLLTPKRKAQQTDNYKRSAKRSSTPAQSAVDEQQRQAQSAVANKNRKPTAASTST